MPSHGGPWTIFINCSSGAGKRFSLQGFVPHGTMKPGVRNKKTRILSFFFEGSMLYAMYQKKMLSTTPQGGALLRPSN